MNEFRLVKSSLPFIDALNFLSIFSAGKVFIRTDDYPYYIFLNADDFLRVYDPNYKKVYKNLPNVNVKVFNGNCKRWELYELLDRSKLKRADFGEE